MVTEAGWYGLWCTVPGGKLVLIGTREFTPDLWNPLLFAVRGCVSRTHRVAFPWNKEMNVPFRAIGTYTSNSAPIAVQGMVFALDMRSTGILKWDYSNCLGG